MLPQPQTILHFWFTELTPKQHFTKDAVLDETIRTRFGATLVAQHSPTQFIVQCPVSALFDAGEYLVAQGALRVAVSQMDYVFRPTNSLLETLFARIGSDGAQ